MLIQALMVLTAAFVAMLGVRILAARRREWAPFAAVAGAVAAGLVVALTGRLLAGGLVAGLGLILFLARQGGRASSGAPAGADALAQARALLGVGRGAGRDAIHAAFRKKVIRAHPDQGGDGARLAALQAARDLLLKEAESDTDRRVS